MTSSRCLLAALVLLAAAPSSAAPPCPVDRVAVRDGRVTAAEAADGVAAIVRDAVGPLRLQAALAGYAFGDAPARLFAAGESMTGVPATPDMRFRSGAVAIAYLGTLLLQLADAGTLGLDAPLATWFPDYPKADRVTLAMLIRGTSGYADYVTDDGFLAAFHADPFRAWTPEELIAIGLARPMACEPGTCWSYAHTNFVILGQVLEKATGRPLDALLRAGVLDPLGLADTRSETTAAIPEPVLHAFDAERGRYEESTFWNPSWTLARGAVMTSTIADILTSAAAIGEGTLVSPAAHALQVDPSTAKFPPWSANRYYGMGVFLIDGWTVQNPSFAGYAATMAYLPARRLAIATSVTVRDQAADGNLSTELLRRIAAYLAPEAPL
ncbi:MAG: serine hydrolase domain-containing protein [Amaricoccus sp.]